MEQKQRVRHRDEAVEPIECCLRTNDIPHHGKLPAEWEMCEMWGLNRTTLRAAIRRLTEMGSLFRKIVKALPRSLSVKKIEVAGEIGINLSARIIGPATSCGKNVK